MAENTTTYTANVDVNVTGGEELKQTGEQAEEAAGGFVKLQLQIRKTQKELQEAAAAGDKVKFKQLRAQLDDLEEGLEKVQFQAKQFDDQLASLPGPAGAAGNAIKGIDGAFKVLIANPIIAVIAAIGGALILMKKALSSTAEGQQTLNRLSQAFSSILGPILATVEKVAVPLFNGFAFVLEKVGQAFSFFAEKLGISQAKIKESTLSVDEVQQKANEAEKKRQEEATKKADEEQKKREENARKAEERKRKREEEAKKKEEERLKNLADANKVLTEAYIATLTERDAEIFKLGQQHNERMLALEKAGITDKTAVAEQYRIELAAINKKYDDQAAKDAEDLKKKDEEEKKKKDEEDKQKAEELANAESQARQDRANRLVSEYEYERALGNAKFEDELKVYDQVRELERAELVAKKASADALVAFDKATAAQRVQIERAQLDTKLSIINDALGAVADAVGRESAAGKAISVAQAVINTYQGATKALATYPPPFGAIAAGTVIAAGLLNVKKILSTQLPPVPKPGGGSASAPAVSSVAPPSLPSGAGIPQIQTQASQGVNAGTQIAQTLSKATNRPVQAYVVSQQVSSQQALDRRTNVAATMG